MGEDKVFIYCIGSDANRQKIGFSKDISQRIRSLQTGNSDILVCHYCFPVSNKLARKIESHIHKEYKHHKLHGEWFSFTKEEAINILKYEEIMIDTTSLYF